LGEDHDGIIELPADAPVGASYADYAGLDDPLIEVAVLPNRPDCMGVRGIARDLAVAGLGTLRPLRQVYRMSDEPLPRSGAGPDIRIEDAEGCPAFYACTVSNVRNGAAPEWMQKALKATGQKPISALVDITNFIMLDLGRPLHVYDLAKLNGPLVARRALPGETVTALNDKDYALDESMTVIADDDGAHDIGGIMGGARTGAGGDTREVLIECAYFTPEHIARTGQRLMLSSDARQRFERGVDPAFLDEGLEIATWLVVEHCGGQASAISRVGTPPVAPRTVAYDPALCQRLGGIDVSNDAQQRILESLGFDVLRLKEGAWVITIPTRRRDIDGPADLVEEIVRIHGIDAVPSTPLPRVPGVARAVASPIQRAERKLRRAAAARGLNECVTWSFIAEREAAAFGGGYWSLANPISEELKVMRPSLLPGLIAAAQRNHDRGAAQIRLFEIGRRYLADGERLTLGFLLAGERTERGWQHGAASRFTAHDAKAEVLELLAAAGAPVDRLMDFGPDAGASSQAYHPGQAGTLRLGPKNILASFGALHPALAKAFGLKTPAVAGEIYLDAVPMKPISDHRRPAFAPPALQAVTRDFAFVLDADIAAADLVRAVKGADKALIAAARIFDRFAGDTLGEAKVSLAVEVTLQPLGASLTEADLKALSDRVVDAAAKLGAELRH
jgi:phenylalanyl-tRNA synthetase beta chain